MKKEKKKRSELSCGRFPSRSLAAIWPSESEMKREECCCARTQELLNYSPCQRMWKQCGSPPLPGHLRQPTASNCAAGGRTDCWVLAVRPSGQNVHAPPRHLVRVCVCGGRRKSLQWFCTSTLTCHFSLYSSSFQNLEPR